MTFVPFSTTFSSLLDLLARILTASHKRTAGVSCPTKNRLNAREERKDNMKSTPEIQAKEKRDERKQDYEQTDFTSCS